MKTYIAGKITGLDNYREHFQKAKEELKAMGITDIVSPIDLPHDHDHEYESYLKEDLIAMLGCQQVYALDNWRNSSGAVREVTLAVELKIKVIYQSNFHF